MARRGRQVDAWQNAGARVELLYIDTGSMYRAVALAVMESSVSSSDDVAVGSLASRVSIDLLGDPDSIEVMLEGRDVTNAIRSEEVTHCLQSSQRYRKCVARWSNVKEKWASAVPC